MFQTLKLLSRVGPHLVRLTLRSVDSLPALREMLGLVPNVLHLRLMYEYEPNHHIDHHDLCTQLDQETVDFIRVTLGAQLRALSFDSNCLGVSPTRPTHLPTHYTLTAMPTTPVPEPWTDSCPERPLCRVH